MIKMDIKPFFWILLNNIVGMEYNQLKKTEEYLLVYECVMKDYFMVLHIDPQKNITIESNDINEIFEDVNMYYKTYDPYSDEHLLIKDALIKIYKFIEIEHTIDHLFDNFKF
jgi:hypothetical protein